MKKCFVMVLLCCLLVAGTAFAKTGTLLVAFGTSMDSARPAIDDIEKAYKKAAGNEPVLLAFTSDIIRNKLAKEGKPVLSVNAAMNELAAQGVTDLKIQSLHIAPAEEYNQLERMVVKNITKNPGVFKTVKVGYPLLVSEKDLDAVVKVVLASLPKDRKPGDANYVPQWPAALARRISSQSCCRTFTPLARAWSAWARCSRNMARTKATALASPIRMRCGGSRRWAVIIGSRRRVPDDCYVVNPNRLGIDEFDSKMRSASSATTCAPPICANSCACITSTSTMRSKASSTRATRSARTPTWTMCTTHRARG